MKVYRANNGKKKISALAICLLLTVVMAVGGTLAYLYTNTNAVTNTFKPAQAPNNIEETMNTDKTVKSDVAISVPSLTENPEAVDVYIRVAMVATWQGIEADNKGVIASKVPILGTDYKVTQSNMVKDMACGCAYACLRSFCKPLRQPYYHSHVQVGGVALHL